MQRCLIVQPIHQAGTDILNRAGVISTTASAADMETVANEVKGCVAVITRNAGFSATAIDAADRLKVIGVHGIGTDSVAVAHASERGIAVINTPSANTQSVAEHAIALLLALAKNLPAAGRAVRSGDFGYKYHSPSLELSEATVGLVGFGRIGQATGRLAIGIGMRVQAISPNRPDSLFEAHNVRRISDLTELMRTSDAISVHVPLTAATRGLIGAKELAALKHGALLVNTSRGDVIDEAALIAAIRRGQIRVGLDVYASENMERGYELLTLENVILTPHTAGSTESALKRSACEVATGVLAVLCGRQPSNLVNAEAWPR